MVKGKTVNGVAIGDRGNEALSTDVVKILKTQDMGYVKVQIAQDEKVSLRNSSYCTNRFTEDRKTSSRVRGQCSTGGTFGMECSIRIGRG